MVHFRLHQNTTGVVEMRPTLYARNFSIEFSVYPVLCYHVIYDGISGILSNRRRCIITVLLVLLI